MLLPLPPRFLICAIHSPCQVFWNRGFIVYTFIMNIHHLVVCCHNVCTDESSKRGQALMVLCEQELMAFDLQAPKWDYWQHHVGTVVLVLSLLLPLSLISPFPSPSPPPFPISLSPLSSLRCPQIRKPYLFSLHSSPVTCLRLFENCSSDFFQSLHEVRITSPPPREHVSDISWPAMGGYVRQAEPSAFDIFVTG